MKNLKTLKNKVAGEKMNDYEYIYGEEILVKYVIDNLPFSDIYVFDKVNSEEEDYKYYIVGGHNLERLGYDKHEIIGSTLKKAFGQNVFNTMSKYYKEALEGKTNNIMYDWENEKYLACCTPLRNSNNEVRKGLLQVINLTQMYDTAILEHFKQMD